MVFAERADRAPLFRLSLANTVTRFEAREAPMKIALVAQNATPLHPRTGSGPDRDDIGLSELTRQLAGQGHQVTVYTQKNLADAPDRVPAFSGPLRSLWESDRPDVVHALAWTSGLAALAAARDLGIPVVQEFNSLSVAERRAAAGFRDEPGAVKADGASAARIRLEPAIGRSANAVVATNSAEVSDLASLGVHRSSIRIVPWGVDTDLFTPEGPVAKRNGRPRLLTATDLTQRKPLETLLRALTKVPDAELLVVGGPAEAELSKDDNYVKLAKFAATLGITDRVIFTGAVEYASMPPLLRSADLVISTCQYEPSGTTSLQAMACGTPVIAPPVGGHMDAVVDGTTGIIIPPDRPALLAQRIRQLLAHPMLIEAYGVAAVDRVRSRYSWSRIAGETLAVYDRVTQAA